MGRGYVIEHCVSALKFQNEENTFRNYVADALKIIAENISAINGGKVLKYRYYDLVNTETKKEERTSEEIINHVLDKIQEVRGSEDESV